jgi:putative Holliday junction resolvase
MVRRRGVRLAVDWGKARIGVAACDPSAVLAYPVTTVAAGEHELATLAALVAEHEPIEVIVGLPRRLAGDEGPAAAYVRERADALTAALVERGLDVPVRLVDERLSTKTASRRLHESGRNTRQQRSVIDAAAAVAILETALAAEDARSTPPGDVVSAPPTRDRSPRRLTSDE